MDSLEFLDTKMRDAVCRIKLIRRGNRNASGCHSVDVGGQKYYKKVSLSLSGEKAKLHLCYLNADTSSDPFGAVWAYENNTRSNFLTNQSDALFAKRSLGSFASPRHNLLLRLRKPLQQRFVPIGQVKSRDSYVDSGAIIPTTMQKEPVRLHISLFWG
jgi:hypothetical protein